MTATSETQTLKEGERYSILKDPSNGGTRIECKCCGHTSYSKSDVEHRYCAHCCVVLDEPIHAMTVFQQEGWYSQERQQVHDFVGIIKRCETNGEVSVGRPHYHYLIPDTSPEKKIPIYTGGRTDYLTPFEDQQVVIRGKLLKQQIESTQGSEEIWPAHVQIGPPN